jgi:hypothetical protein
MSETSILLAVPHYGELAPEALRSLVLPTARHRLKIQTNGASLLAHNFNRLWCAALNQRRQLGLTHFAMHHADVAGGPGWLDVLVEEMDRVGADVLSVIIPIKDGRGLTSTGLQDPHSDRIRRLTMKEVWELPPTFSARDLEPGKRLMVNTGLWICDYTRPWVEEVCFEVRDRIDRGEDGLFRANVLSEDWNFSGWCADRGLKVFATRAVAVAHLGRAAFRNDSAWGDWRTDLGDETPYPNGS